MSTPDVAPANWYERHVFVADLVIAIVAFVVLGLTSSAMVVASDAVVFGVLLPLGMCAALVFRRSRTVLFVSLVAAIAVIEMLVFPYGLMTAADVIVLVAVHTAARYGTRWFAYGALAAAIVGAWWATIQWVLLPSYSTDYRNEVAQALFIGTGLTLVVVGSYVLGRTQLAKVRAIGAQLAGLAERNDLLRHEHEQQLRLATEEERGRIAAETHDILAHSLAIIVAQADGAAMVVAKNPGRAQQAIEQIAETSREALAEVRQKVAALRRGEDPTSDLAPAKSLRDLPELIDNVRRAGLTATLSTHGDLDRVAAGPALSAYRIVQEALTNALKHGGPQVNASVEVAREARGLRITVEDDGRGVVHSDDSGSGLAGMRARVEQYGGVLAAGPRVGGGFQVHAMMPLPDAAP
ncbi:MAG: sensor histidine kinase [Cumulibacter sp.]